MALRIAAFYATAVALLVASVAIHEYGHYAAHEGQGVPPVQFHGSVASANEALLVQDGQGPRLRDDTSTIVFLPNTLTQALTLGLVPASAYPDDGVLALTYLDGPEQASAGSPWTSVEGAPVAIAGLAFLATLAWTLWTRGLVARASLFASAVALGNTRHHMEGVGMDAAAMELLTGSAMAIAMIMALAGQTFRALLSNAQTPDTPQAKPEPTPRPAGLRWRAPEDPSNS